MILMLNSIIEFCDSPRYVWEILGGIFSIAHIGIARVILVDEVMQLCCLLENAHQILDTGFSNGHVEISGAILINWGMENIRWY